LLAGFNPQIDNIKSPLGHRYDNIDDYAKMLNIIENGAMYANFDQLVTMVKG